MGFVSWFLSFVCGGETVQCSLQCVVVVVTVSAAVRLLVAAAVGLVVCVVSRYIGMLLLVDAPV